MTIRGITGAFALAAALAAGAFAAPAAGAAPLRVCADPDNLPFSKSEGPERGMYVELAELVGKQLNQPVEYNWYYTQNQRRALRNTIMQDACDAVFALPADADYKVRGLQRTPPFLQVGYAIVAASAFAPKSLADLKGRHVAVQFGTTPHILLNQFEGFRSTTYRSAEEALAALAKGEVDTAFLWGPTAGYENKTRWDGRWKVTPVTGHDLSGAVAVAVRRGKDELAQAIARALGELQPQIAALADKYGFPREAPVDLALAGAAPRPGAVVPAAVVVSVVDSSAAAASHAAKKAAQRPPPAKATSATPTAATAVTVALSEGAAAGRQQFNSRCSHCHGADAFSPVRERDLRFLKMRYGDKWQDTAIATIRNGRPDAGMPTWKDALADGEIRQIVSFFDTIQK